MRPRFLAVALLFAATLAAVPAAAQNAYEQMRPGVGDAAYLSVAVPIDLGLLFVHPAPAPRAESDPFVLDRLARDGLDWRRPDTAAKISDWLLRGFMVSTLTAPVVGNLEGGRGTANGTLVGFEAMVATQLVTGTIKHVVRRERPDGEARHGGEAWASFFSGHSSMSFTGATMLTLYAHTYDWGDAAEIAVPVTAYSLAAFTAYLRVAGRRHWLTDVLAGAAVGTGTALLTHHLRTRL